ncbi:MAG TPA: phosphoribosylaminoimidazolesuccinocarboxamide synthase [Streptosporangiaceae bacterium]|nr:phosphoribosylaminoimidazolesuccinocarboxamide synthase [Streptosporangiaceae bacterium]
MSPPAGDTAGQLTHLYSGKVREVYQMRGGLLLLVATDRISAYDHVLPTPIPDKGKILTQLSLWWFRQLADLVPNHLADAPVPAEFAGRAMVCQQLSMIGVECVARGYLAGSGWHDYQRTQAVCGTALPPGLVEGGQLPGGPIFTPASKAPRGEHDENIPVASVAGLVGAEVAAELERITLEVYRRGAEVAARGGIIVADTKIELGADAGGRLLLADEVLTPDSSRFWPAGQWRPGRPQPSFDKQYLRDWLDSPESGWDRHRPGAEPPELPERVVERTRALYIEAYERITGLRWG